MAFQGYFLKINNAIFPMKYIAIETYKITPNQKIDLDSYTDADGKLHRKILPHTRSKIEFNTPYVWLPDKTIIQGLIADDTNVSATYWNDKTNEYISGIVYIPDITYEPCRITTDNIQYKPIRIALIEY